MTPLDVEGRHPSGERMRLRQVLPKQGGLYQPRMVAGLLQLSPERLPPPRRRKHRRKHPRHPADRREPHHPRPAGGLWLHRAEDAEPLRRLPDATGDGRLYRDGRFRLSTRPSRTGIWLGMVSAHYARSALRTRGLPPRPHATKIARENARPFQKDFAEHPLAKARPPAQIIQAKSGLLYLSYLRRRRQNSLVKWNLMCLKSICAIWST